MTSRRDCDFRSAQRHLDKRATETNEYSPNIPRLPVPDPIELGRRAVQLREHVRDRALGDADDLGLGAVVAEFLGGDD